MLQLCYPIVFKHCKLLEYVSPDNFVHYLSYIKFFLDMEFLLPMTSKQHYTEPLKHWALWSFYIFIISCSVQVSSILLLSMNFFSRKNVVFRFLHFIDCFKRSSSNIQKIISSSKTKYNSAIISHSNISSVSKKLHELTLLCFSVVISNQCLIEIIFKWEQT